jgi:hypothetical protein
LFFRPEIVQRENAMVVKYINLDILSSKEKAELKKILKAQRKEIQDFLDDLAAPSKKKSKKSKKAKG